MDKKDRYFSGLVCRECGRSYPSGAIHVCEYDFGPLEVAYDYEKIARALSREILAKRPETMWRFKELLPVAGEPTV
ncbi:MAG: threonine synthase, partial [Verrucomicrobiae bacterium]|nr:threonine synthase [Verrucomicrobiae bacterium]